MTDGENDNLFAVRSINDDVGTVRMCANGRGEFCSFACGAWIVTKKGKAFHQACVIFMCLSYAEMFAAFSQYMNDIFFRFFGQYITHLAGGLYAGLSFLPNIIH